MHGGGGGLKIVQTEGNTTFRTKIQLSPLHVLTVCVLYVCTRLFTTALNAEEQASLFFRACLCGSHSTLTREIPFFISSHWFPADCSCFIISSHYLCFLLWFSPSRLSQVFLTVFVFRCFVFFHLWKSHVQIFICLFSYFFLFLYINLSVPVLTLVFLPLDSLYLSFPFTSSLSAVLCSLCVSLHWLTLFPNQWLISTTCALSVCVCMCVGIWLCVFVKQPQSMVL